MSEQSQYFNAVDAMPAAEVHTYAKPGAVERILYRDPVTGSYARMLDMPPGMVSGSAPLAHDFDEIVFVVSGRWVNQTDGSEHGPGTIAVFPKGAEHGPFEYPEGARFLEFRHIL